MAVVVFWGKEKKRKKGEKRIFFCSTKFFSFRRGGRGGGNHICPRNHRQYTSNYNFEIIYMTLDPSVPSEKQPHALKYKLLCSYLFIYSIRYFIHFSKANKQSIYSL